MKTIAPILKDSYFDLIRQFPLVSIRTEKQYESALRFLQRLAIRDESTFDSGERAYLDALTQFVEDYEQQHHRIEVSRLKPLDALKYLMSLNGMKPVDLGRLLGSRSLASQILNGRRELSKTHIVALSRYFNVEPGLFL
jgi:HTH-type transcriptional regulator / antitoxin HigA